MRRPSPHTMELDLSDLDGLVTPPGATRPLRAMSAHVAAARTMELDLETIDGDPTLEEAARPAPRPGAIGRLAAWLAAMMPVSQPARTGSVGRREAEDLLRRARSLLAVGALQRDVVGAEDARARFERLLARAELSAEHAAEVARMRAEALRADGAIDDAVLALKRALHLAHEDAEKRAIFARLAEIYAGAGEPSEARYYARRAGQVGTLRLPRHDEGRPAARARVASADRGAVTRVTRSSAPPAPESARRSSGPPPPPPPRARARALPPPPPPPR